MSKAFLKDQLRTRPKIVSDRYKLPDDKRDHQVRIVPFDQSGRWSFPVVQHWAPNPDSDSEYDTGYICAAEQPIGHVIDDTTGTLPVYGRECPFELKAEAVKGRIDKLEEQTERDERTRTEIKFLRSLQWKLTAQRSYYMWVLDREDGSLKEFFAPAKLYDAILEAYTNAVLQETNCADTSELMVLPDDQIPDLFDPASGFDVLLRKSPSPDKKRGYSFAAKLVTKRDALSTNKSEQQLLLQQATDPVRRIKKDILEQAETVDGAVELLVEQFRDSFKRRQAGGSLDLGRRGVRSDDELFDEKERAARSRAIVDDERDTRPARSRPPALPQLEAEESRARLDVEESRPARREVKADERQTRRNALEDDYGDSEAEDPVEDISGLPQDPDDGAFLDPTPARTSSRTRFPDDEVKVEAKEDGRQQRRRRAIEDLADL